MMRCVCCSIIRLGPAAFWSSVHRRLQPCVFQGLCGVKPVLGHAAGGLFEMMTARARPLPWCIAVRSSHCRLWLTGKPSRLHRTFQSWTLWAACLPWMSLQAKLPQVCSLEMPSAPSDTSLRGSAVKITRPLAIS